MKKITNTPPPQDEDTNNKQKIVDLEDKKKQKKEKESRTVETFFRNALRSNLDLTALADSKASILISVNGFILTVIVTASGVYLDNPDMIYPFIAIITTALLSISLATMAIHPRLKKHLIKKSSYDEFNSILYYQDMSDLEPDKYVRKVKSILKNKEKIYTHIIKHFHILGTEIAIKYKWLRRAYVVFALGLIISSVSVVFSLVKMKKVMLPSTTQFEKIFEPSGAVNLPDGKVLLVQDEGGPRTLELVKPNKDNTVTEIGEPKMSKKIKKIFKKKIRDIEGITSNNANTIYVITSHTTNKSRKRKKAREEIAQFTYKHGKIKNVKLYHGLLNDLKALHPAFKKAMSDLRFSPRKSQINIEGLSWDRKRKNLLIAFRSPLIKGKAVIVILKNPNEIFDKHNKLRLKEPILLDLHGHGIRGLAWDKKRQGYWISAGSVGSRKNIDFTLWFWDKQNHLLKEEKNDIGFAEGLTTLEDGRILVVNDDGSVSTHGANYKLFDANKSVLKATTKWRK